MDIDKIVKEMLNQSQEYHTPKAKNKEAEYRSNLIGLARDMGCEEDLKQIFQKYDDLLRSCTNPQERKEISARGIMEVNNLFNFYGPLSVGNVQVIPANKK